MIEYIIPIAHAAEEAANAEAQTGLLGTFGVNWKFFIAQLINFSIVVFIFWKWVLTPVALKLTERSEQISTALKDAEKIQEEKKEFDIWKQEEMSKARKQASEIINEASHEAEKIKQETLLRTKVEQDKIVNVAKAQILEEQEKSVHEIKSQVADLITTSTEKILKSKLDEKKDKDLIKETLKNI